MPVSVLFVLSRSEQNDLRFIGREFNKRGEKLRNDRSAYLNLVKTGGRERER